MNFQNTFEQALDKITVDIYNKRVIIRGEHGTTLIFKCASINELVELKQQCSRVLKSENFIYR
jgi:hypothetical protein